MIGAVSSYPWAKLFRLAVPSFLIGGIVPSETTRHRTRSGTSASEIRTLLDLGKLGETMSRIGAIVRFGFAFWLIDVTRYNFENTWVIAALALFVLLGTPIDTFSKQRKLARVFGHTLPDDATGPSPELDQLVRSRRLTALAHLSSLMVVAILIPMIWKPGA
jgi:hypothetical protein